MEMVISQAELKQFVKEYVEKRGHVVSSVELYARVKTEDDLVNNRKVRQALFSFLNVVDSSPPVDLHMNILEYLDFSIICEIDL